MNEVELSRKIVTMEGVINNDQFDSEDIERTKNQVKLFTIASARRKLKTILKLTETLEKLQDKYQDVALKFIEDSDDYQLLSTIPSMIQVLINSLNNSRKDVEAITSNDKLMSLLSVNVTNNKLEVNKNEINLGSVVSRNKVRDFITELLAETETKTEPLNDSEIE